jgi:hypothetical protein
MEFPSVRRSNPIDSGAAIAPDGQCGDGIHAVAERAGIVLGPHVRDAILADQAHLLRLVNGTSDCLLAAVLYLEAKDFRPATPIDSLVSRAMWYAQKGIPPALWARRHEPPHRIGAPRPKQAGNPTIELSELATNEERALWWQERIKSMARRMAVNL